MSSSGAAARDGRLLVGMRILEVSNHSLLGMTHTEAVRVLRAVGDTLFMLVCDGFDPGNAAAIEVRETDIHSGLLMTLSCRVRFKMDAVIIVRLHRRRRASLPTRLRRASCVRTAWRASPL